jgi:hypothetical protein
VHANLVTARFRNVEATQTAKAQLGALLPELAKLPGVVACYHVQTGPREIVNVTVYASQADAQAGLANLGPRVQGVLGPLVEAPPQVASGPVVGHV